MTIRKLLSLFFVVIVVELVALAFTIFLIVAGQRDLAETENRQYQAYKIADELRQSSDDLTRMARSYVVTGDPAFEQYFRKILGIRNGTSPRPLTYDRIYWDFVVAAGDAGQAEGPAVSLKERMGNLNLTEHERKLLEQAQATSDALVSLENKAMNAVKGLFVDGQQARTEQRSPDPELARSLMFGKEYHAAKAAIMRPIDMFLVSLENRMIAAVDEQRKRVGKYVSMSALLVALTLLSFALLALAIGRRVLGPVDKLLKQSDAIRRGDYGHQVALEGDDEIARLSRGVNLMSQSIELDISERKATEEALRNSQRLLETVLDHMPAHIFLRDINGKYLLINGRYEKIFGVSRQNTIGKSLRDVLPKDLANLFAERDRMVVDERRVVENETHIPSENGERIFATSCFPIYGSEDTVTLIGGVSFEITDRRRAEEAEHRQSQKMELFGQITGSVAHDFNNVLTVLCCNLPLLKSERITPEKQQKLINDCIDAAGMGSNLTKRLMTIARKEALAKTSIELNTLISDLVDFLQRSVAQQNVSIDVALSEDRLPVYVDVVLVEMALLNLVINARDAMPDGGTITISSGQAIIDETTEADWGTAAPGRYAFVQVADGGVGMAPEIKKKIFKAFFTTKEKGKGTGLGLSAVQDLARESDGFVQINSEPGKGTEVKVFLRSRRARRAT